MLLLKDNLKNLDETKSLQDELEEIISDEVLAYLLTNKYVFIDFDNQTRTSFIKATPKIYELKKERKTWKN